MKCEIYFCVWEMMEEPSGGVVMCTGPSGGVVMRVDPLGVWLCVGDP